MSDHFDNSANENDRYTVPALERGLRLLACFNSRQPVWSAPDLARLLELPRSTIFRMLSTLEVAGYLQRSGTEYSLGLGVLRLGYDYLSTQPLAQLASPVLQQLCDELGMTCNLALRDGSSVIYVARIAPPGSFQGAVRVGSRLPSHATVLGRALLQDMDTKALQSVFGGAELQQFSENTPRDIDALMELLDQDKARGYAIGEGFYEPGVSSIAATVRDSAGKVIAGLGIAIPFTELVADKTEEWARQVCNAALTITSHLREQRVEMLR